ncbi:MAG: O-antigen ligase family protein, partial [Saprospiraceae bacterium]|nr:O-antigen ligase family protein [Saprospiraceae bacterium]
MDFNHNVNGAKHGCFCQIFFGKTWYIVTFYFLAAWVLRSERDFKRFFWSIFIPLSIAVVITLYRYSFYDFDFAFVEKVMNPMFRNHVNYACIMVLFLPYIWFMLLQESRFNLKYWLLLGSIFLFIFAIQTSYTRAAYIAGFAAVGYYFIIKWRLTKFSLLAVSIVAIAWLTYVVNDGKYLDFAPNFEKTITHRDFNNLVEATAKGEDISTMERVYRWVAGFHMVGERPWVGFGPNNFVNFYKKYSVSSFKTYVSDNKDNSTVHCYYLLVAVEQGIIGLLIFMALVFYTLIIGERVYHQSKGFERSFAMASTLSFFIILLLLLINEF